MVKSILSLEIDPDITTVLFKEEVWQTNIHNEKLNSFSKEVTYNRELVNFDELEDFEASDVGVCLCPEVIEEEKVAEKNKKEE